MKLEKPFLLILLFTLVASTKVRAGDERDTMAKSLLVEFTEAVIAGPYVLTPPLAPEYQIMRSNGVGYDRDEYLKRGVKTLEFVTVFSHEDLVVTAHDDVLVVRYML